MLSSIANRSIWRRVIFFLLIILFGCIAIRAVFSATTRLATADLTFHTLVHEEITRTFAVYVPDNVGPEPRPLVFLLHGGGGSINASWTFEDGQLWRALADREGIILILPEGIQDPGKPNAHHWNDCRTDIIHPDVATTADDVGFILEVLDWAKDELAVDRRRVYATGASNGGMMTFRLLSEAPAAFAAGAPVIANMPEPSECQPPAVPLPVMIINGTDDPLVPYGGGCVAGSSCERGAVMSTAETVDLWVALNGITEDPLTTALPDIVPDDQSTVEVIQYLDPADSRREVLLYRVDGGGHTVPGPAQQSALVTLIVGEKNRDIDAREEIWAFFSRHARPELTEKVFLPQVMVE
ncbi:MAG: PHB depolymerase family esterase [Ardenticatenaceae bacterium]|nr:PHB depolymerase family esterase [Ardenticatenaceae bacterium]